MTRAVFNEIHNRLAHRRYFALVRAGDNAPDNGIRAFADTHDAARTAYRALPWWHRHGWRRLPPPAD